MKLHIQFQKTDKRLNVNFSEMEQTLHIEFGEFFRVFDDIPQYDGEYQLTPSAKSEQTLETAQKFLTKDVTVIRIPYYDVGNAAGGRTVYIANEV